MFIFSSPSKPFTVVTAIGDAICALQTGPWLLVNERQPLENNVVSLYIVT